MSESTGPVQAPTAASRTDIQVDGLKNWAGWYGLLALTLIGVIAVVDRQVFVLAAGPIKAALQLSDFELGLLQGLGVALFAAVAAFPFGWLSDRIDRRLVLVLGVLIWSAALCGSAWATSFAGLFVFASLVAGGESAIVPVGSGLVAEWFTGKARVTANSVAVIGGRLGSSVALVICGYLIAFSERVRPQLPEFIGRLETWRVALLLAACSAPLLLILAASLPKGERRQADASHVPQPIIPLAELLLYLRQRTRFFLCFLCGLGFVQIGFAAVLAWFPIVAARNYHATPVEVGNAFGLTLTVSVVSGIVFSFAAPRWLAPRVGPRLPIWVLMWASFLVIPPTLLMVVADSFNVFFVQMGVFGLMTTAGNIMYLTSMQELSPRRMLGRIVALVGVFQLAFSAGAPPLVGWLSDHLPGERGLLNAMVGVAVTAFLLSGWLLWLGNRSYVDAVLAARAYDAR
jgi:MFS family permease